MDKKKEIILKITRALNEFKGNHNPDNDALIIVGRELDLIIYTCADKFDKNIKYEFRNFLLVLNLISEYNSSSFSYKDCFILEKKKIELFLSDNS